VPSDWAHLPAYRLSPGDEITVAERSRGPGDEDRNQIAVERNLWWDFAGTGYTFQDLVSGRMQQDWRLAMAEPYRLQGARQNGQPLLVTQGEDDRAGIEVRTPDLGIEATGRIEQRGALPASGWTTRLASLGITLRLPPIAENGNTVPLSVSVESPMTAADHVKAVHLFADKNPTPDLATFRMTPAMGRASADTRIRLGQTQDLIAVAETSDGKVFIARAEVKVTIGGCRG
jgi:predicted secreted protein